MSQIILPFVELIVTTKCNLKCMDCSNLIPSYRSSMYDVSADEIRRSLDALLEPITELTYLKIHGGEPLLSAYIEPILHDANGREKVKHIIVPTNGSYLPPESVMAVLGQYSAKTKLVVSNYAHCRENHEKLVQLCQKHGVVYSISREKEWYSFGPVQPYHQSSDALAAKYARCEMKRFPAMYRGKLYPCARIAHGIYLGMIPAQPQWEFDILRAGGSERRQLLERFMSLTAHPACDYCTMDNIRDRKSGEQP